MTIQLGLFDIHQIDPTVETDAAAVFRGRLDDLAYADGLGGFAIAFTAVRHHLATYRCQAASVWLGAASQRVATMRLGTLAYTLPIHPPLALAEEIATLDQLTGGRIEVGVGLGHRVEELVANGVDPADRVGIFQERLAILEGLLSGGRVTVTSEHTTLREAFIHPTPVQQPHPPLWFAGTDPTATTWAGQHGLNLAIGFAPNDALTGATAGFRQGVAMRAQRSPADDGIRRGQVALMRHTYVADTDEQAEREMIDDLVRLKGGGSEGDRADRRESARADRARLIEQEIFVAGGPEAVAAQIARSRVALGAEVYLANVYAAGVEQERVRRTLRLLSGPVRDALSGAANPPEDA